MAIVVVQVKSMQKWYFLVSKPILNFFYLKIVTVDNKNAIETPFLAVLSPQKGSGKRQIFSAQLDH